MSKDKDMKAKEKHEVKTGFFEDGLPYARIGNKPNFIVFLEALTFTNEPPSGFALKQFLKSAKSFLDEYTVYQIGRKQNVPEDYTFTDMANDYATMIKREFKQPVIIIGASTGGQIAQYLAADHSELIRKLIIISAAYRVSEQGAEIETQAAEYFKQQKYGKSLSKTLELVFSPGIKRGLLKCFVRLIGRSVLGKIEYPNDFLTEVRGDVEMNFKDRLKEIKSPTLILSGELDIEYVPEDVRTTAEGIPNAKMILFEGYGHGLAANWNVLQKDIEEFLKE